MNLQTITETSQSWQHWALSDADGQRVALGAGLVLLLALAMLGRKLMRRLLAQCRHLPHLMLLTVGGFYGAVWGLGLGPEQWGLAAAAAGISLLLLALASSSANRSKKQKQKARSKGAPAHA
jgi:hypothetical protein